MEKMSTKQLKRMLKELHRPPQWAIFFEVANATGQAKARIADAVAMNLWPSRGLTIRGFEIKVSRSDYKRENDIPQKAEEIAAYCDEWWIVTPKDLIKTPAIELPAAWGLLEASEGKLRVTKAAKRTKAKSLDRAFGAAFFRAAHKEIDRLERQTISLSDIADRLSCEYKRGYAAGKEDALAEVKRLKQIIDQKEKVLHDFKERTGIQLGVFSADRDITYYNRGKQLTEELGNLNRHASILEREAEAMLRLSKLLAEMAPQE